VTISLDSISVPESATAQRIVEAAAAIIAGHGEGHLRINDVCAAAGVTSTTLYSLLGDRERLITTALLHLVSTTSYDAIRQFQSLVMESTTRSGFTRMLTGVTNSLLEPDRRRTRRVRLHALGSIRHRPALGEAVGALLRHEIDLFASWIERADDDGLISVDDPQSTAAWALAYTLAHTALDGDGVSSHDAHWDDVWRWGLRSVVVGDAGPFPTKRRASQTSESTHLERHPTALRIIDWAADRIDMVGESAFRAEHLPPEIAKSTTPIYRYFGTRENLVGAAQEERFSRSVMAIIDATDSTDARGLITASFSPDRADARVRRLEAIAATLGRADIAQAIAERRDTNLAAIADALSTTTTSVDLFDGVRLGAALLTALAIVEVLDLGIDADAHRSISLSLLERALTELLA
jgi:AcrR family transcriptional regulator